MRPVLVTGGTGFLGSHLVDLLVEKGHDVVVMDNGSRSSLERCPAGVRLIEGDVRSPEAWLAVEAAVEPSGAVDGAKVVNEAARADRLLDGQPCLWGTHVAFDEPNTGWAPLEG